MAYECSVYGLSLRANQAIPGVPPATSSSTDIEVCLGYLPQAFNSKQHRIILKYISEYCDVSGQPGLKVFTIDDSYYNFQYADQTEFLVNREGSRIWATWPESQTIEDMSTYLLGPIMGFVLLLRGAVSLHASAITIGNEGIAFVGPAGAGKSTTAAAFAHLGYPVVAEDVTSLVDCGDQFLIQPAYPCIRLWPKSVAGLYGPDIDLPRLTPTWDKRCLDLTEAPFEFRSEPVPLVAIYLLGERSQAPEAPYIEAVSPRDATIGLVANTYATNLMDKTMRSREFELLGRLQQKIPVRKVTPHIDYSRLSKFRDVIIADFQKLSHNWV